MKNIKRYIGFVAIVALLFTSCTKEENNLPNTSDSELAKLSFAPLLDDLENSRAVSKQAQEIPECSEAAPNYVEIILSQNGTDKVGSMGSPFKLSLVANQLFTQEVPELELPPGTYSLDHFAVYDADDNLIWLAPKTGGNLADFVDDPLPLAINLGAGVKKYVDVTVLCFDDREVNEYGYLFFELNPEVALEFCFFANYCDDSGRHYPASYSVSIWKGTSNTGELLYSNIPNVTGQYPAPNDDYYASPLCFALPSNANMAEKYLYYEVTLLSWPDVYGTVSEPNITGTLSMNDIIANQSGNDTVEYEHLRFNCGEDDGNGECDLNDPLQDCDGDGVLNGVDECPTVPGPAENNGCPVECDPLDPEADCNENGTPNKCDPAAANYNTFDCDGDDVLNGDDDCPTVPGPADNNGCPVDSCAIEAPDSNCDVAFFEGSQSFTQIVDPQGPPTFYALLDGTTPVGSVTTSINANGDPVVIINMGFDYSMDDYKIEVSQNADGSNSTCVAENNVSPPTGENPDVLVIFSNTANYVYPFYLKIEANYCP